MDEPREKHGARWQRWEVEGRSNLKRVVVVLVVQGNHSWVSDQGDEIEEDGTRVHM